jgi:hypothetical protein
LPLVEPPAVQRSGLPATEHHLRESMHRQVEPRHHRR